MFSLAGFLSFLVPGSGHCFASCRREEAYDRVRSRMGSASIFPTIDEKVEWQEIFARIVSNHERAMKKNGYPDCLGYIGQYYPVMWGV